MESNKPRNVEVIIYAEKLMTVKSYHFEDELEYRCKPIMKTTGTLAQRLGCSPMARETWVQSQVESDQRL